MENNEKPRKETYEAGSPTEPEAQPVAPAPEPTPWRPGPAPATSPTPTPAEAVTAERYIHRRLEEARRSLRLTQVIASLLTLFIIGYVGYITYRLEQTLEPRNAAQVAQGLIAQQVEQQGPELINEFKERIPALIEQAPDYALERLPEYRKQLEDQIVQDMERHFEQNSQKLSAVMDEVLTENQAEIQAMLETGDDSMVASELARDMERRFMNFLEETPVTGGETITVKLEQSLKGLKKIESDMERLAQGENLSEQEQQARRAIAILAQAIKDRQQPSNL